MQAPARKPRLRIERNLILDRVVYSVRLGTESFEPIVPDIETLKIVRAAVDLKDNDAARFTLNAANGDSETNAAIVKARP